MNGNIHAGFASSGWGSSTARKLAASASSDWNIIQSGHRIVPDSFIVELAHSERWRYESLSSIREDHRRPLNYKELERYYGLEHASDDTDLLGPFNIYVKIQGMLE